MAECELRFVESEIPPYLYSQTGEIDIIEGVHDNEHNQVTWHTSAGYFLSCDCSRESADAKLGCNLTPPVNNSYTGSPVVSSSLLPLANVFIGISKVTTKHTSIARVAAPYLDVVSLNGVRHHMGQRSMPKAAVSLR